MIIIRNRELVIPHNERFIGTTYDTNSDFRQIQIDRIGVNGVDISNLNFYLDFLREDGTKDSILLEKEVHNEYIILTWGITQSHTAVPGTLFVNLRAKDDNSSVRWGSNRAAFYVDGAIDAQSQHAGKVSEFEQYENRINANLGKIQRLKEQVESSNAAAREELKLKTAELYSAISTNIADSTSQLRASIEEEKTRLNSLSEEVKQSQLQTIQELTGKIDALEAQANERLQNVTQSLNEAFTEKEQELSELANRKIEQAMEQLASLQNEFLRSVQELKESFIARGDQEIRVQNERIESEMRKAIDDHSLALSEHTNRFIAEINGITEFANRTAEEVNAVNERMKQFLTEYEAKLASGELRGEKGEKGENGDAAIATNENVGVIKGGTDLKIQSDGEAKINTEFEFTDIPENNLTFVPSLNLSTIWNLIANLFDFVKRIKALVKPATQEEPGMIALGEDFSTTDGGKLKLNESVLDAYMENHPVQNQYEFDLTDRSRYPIKEYLARELCSPNMNSDAFYLNLAGLEPGLHYIKIRYEDKSPVVYPTFLELSQDHLNQYQYDDSRIFTEGSYWLLETKVITVDNQQGYPEASSKIGYYGENVRVIQKIYKIDTPNWMGENPTINEKGYYDYTDGTVKVYIRASRPVNVNFSYNTSVPRAWMMSRWQLKQNLIGKM